MNSLLIRKVWSKTKEKYSIPIKRLFTYENVKLFLDKSIKFVNISNLTSFLTFATLLLGSFHFFIPPYLDSCDSTIIYSQLQSGQKNLSTSNRKYFKRLQFEEEIKKTISSDEFRVSYFLLVGEQGTGKTSLMKYIVKNSDGGMIYVSCGKDPLKFGQAFADAISYTAVYEPSKWRSIFSSLYILPTISTSSSMSEYWACEKKFLEAVKRYKRETKHVPILVIDNVNRFLLHEDGKNFLLNLQDFAKEWADDNILTVVFICSDGQGQQLLRSQSVRSRMEILEITDLEHDEIWKYLEFQLTSSIVEENKKELEDAVINVTGGRIINLAKVVSSIRSKVPISEICNKILSTADDTFKSAGMASPDDPRYHKFWEFSKILLKNDSISDLNARKFLGEQYNELRKSNVFAYHEKDKTITFQSVAHKTKAKVLYLAFEEELKKKKSWFSFFSFIFYSK